MKQSYLKILSIQPIRGALWHFTEITMDSIFKHLNLRHLKFAHNAMIIISIKIKISKRKII